MGLWQGRVELASRRNSRNRMGHCD